MTKFFRTLFATLLTALASCAASPSYAEGLSFDLDSLKPELVGVHLYTFHSNAHISKDYVEVNNVNPGLYARWSNGLTIGFYKNSEWNFSHNYSGYVAKTWERDLIGDLKGALTVGVVSGYSTGRTDLLPMVVPSISYDRVRASFVPGLGCKGNKQNPEYCMPAGIHISVEHRF